MRKIRLGMLAICLLMTIPQLSRAQNEPMIAVVQTKHFKPTDHFSFADWRAAEKEYFDKVTAKNDLVKAANLLVHYYTPDNSEVLFFTLYDSWDDVEKASTRDGELIKAAWPDSVKRRTAMQKLSDNYTSQHSDEIMSTIPQIHIKPTDSAAHIYYVRRSHLSFPKDGKNEEIVGGMNEYTDNVIAKNDLVRGYYIYRHLYGADSRDLAEVFIYNSLADLEKAASANTELAKKYWPDEKKMEEAGAKVNRYFEPWHGDAIYRSLSGFQK